MIPDIPADFARRMREIFGADGEAWLAGLPALVAATEARWGTTVGPPFPLTYSYVAPVVRADGSEAVLKMAVPHPDATRAIAALQLYDGRGSVRLLAADAGQGIALLERLRPGTTLFDLGDDTAATQIAAEVMQQLWRPAP